ncbi:indolepyruvate oxidoreductase subunit beta family protein [Alphaproteobacteria bacterium GH1-50]|uniref:Indolepyruvate oxidoreductase subunit beta family protein n=1 Tax=Kangsaoukella pontilimi TaxID=2691042 RepID=A0A7C9MZ90_9RHOB|nr:indolepyruvate oxidoreductase subunit beta family protein [Kangsaoukella pontilimi]MXQ07298.1 indolepyruvate oxidoreductase subunit beta family protein [Kangsaoukella pontilimi]
MSGATKTQKPVRLLIAAMGGEGGGVLAGWLTEAALDAGLWVQRTSVPGVAQRTGATTYYLEFLPKTGDKRPVMALHPAPGKVDVLVATELLEAVRMVKAGYVTPDRTRLFASRHRTFTVDEKSAMEDGRLEVEPMVATLRNFAAKATISDFSKEAQKVSAHLNSVVMGLVAGSGVLPIPVESCLKAVQSGKRASEANLRGFEAGLALAAEASIVPDLTGKAKAAPAPEMEEAPTPVLVASPETEFLTGEAAGLAAEGMRRLTDYQDRAYAETYLSHLKRVSEHPNATPELLAALARHMAVRMSYEDTHRVAELKLRQARLARVRAEAKARAGDIVDVREYMKPGPEEVFGMLPKSLGERLIAMSQRNGWSGYSWPMKVKTTRFSGFIRLKFLAYAKRWRQKNLRHHEEMEWLDLWLGHVEKALDVAPDAAIQIVETARLVRGYASTYKRGTRNWRLIEGEVIAPCLDGRLPSDMLADAVLQARLAAVKDPDSAALDQVVAAFKDVAGSRKPALDAAE